MPVVLPLYSKSRENVVIRIEDASSEQFNVLVNEIGQEGEGYMVGTAMPEQSSPADTLSHPH